MAKGVVKAQKFGLLLFVKVAFFLLANAFFLSKIIFGEHGLLEYRKTLSKYNQNKIALEYIKEENERTRHKLSLFTANSVNLLYLEEQARLHLNYGKETEVLIMMEDE